MNKKILCAVLLSFILHCHAMGNTLTVGINSCSEPLSHPEVIASFLHTIKKTLEPLGYRIEEKYLDLEKLSQAVKEGEIDCFLASSGFYRRLSGEGIRDLATAVSVKEPNPNLGAAASFIVLKNNPSILSISDLRGKSISAKVEEGFAGWLVPLEAIFQMGFNPKKFFSKISFVGPNVDEIVTNVLTGKTDAGTLPSCFLEGYLDRHPEDAEKLRVLNRIEPDKNFGCVRSTDLYPNWTVVATPKISPELSKIISTALLSANPDKNGISWSIATQFQRIDQLLKDLKEGPYYYLRDKSVKAFLKEYWFFFAIVFILLGCLLLHYLRVNQLVKKRTEQLRKAICSSQNNLNIAKETRMKLTAIERLGKVSFLSTIIAHELKQPLTAICCYTNGLKTLIGEEGDLNLKNGIDEISALAKRSSQLIEHVRAIAKEESSQVSLCDISQLLSSTVNQYISSVDCSVEIKLFCEAAIFAMVDPLEMELVFLNLLRNAGEATHGKGNGIIKLSLRFSDEKIFFICEDNGVGLTDEKIMELNSLASTVSDKVSGLGLGLSIVKGIIRGFFGSIRFDRSSLGGLKVLVIIPSCKNK